MKKNEKLKQLRIDNRMTQKELAKKLDISIPTLQKYEYGTINIKNDIIIKLCNIFNISPKDFLSEEEYKSFEREKKVIEITQNISEMVNFTTNNTPDKFLEFLNSFLDFEYKILDNDYIFEFKGTNTEVTINKDNFFKVMNMVKSDIHYNFSKYLNIFGKIEKIENEEENSEKDSD
jgi:transcriptional regulator with XRE-family HTH domain